jgi:ferric-dicitrate binding protein FerR (iron transport regulator)
MKILQSEFSTNVGNGEALDDHQARKLLAIIHGKIKTDPARIIKFPTWKKIASAAAVFILIFSGAYLLFFNNMEIGIVKNETNKPLQNDIAPGGNKAVLTLTDGSVIILDDAQNGTISQQGNTKILKLDEGQLAYKVSGKSDEILYNTISTPRGGQYQMTLSDGTKVWLNSVSSIRFPAAFVGKERKVELTGEGYFEVAKNASMPFKVDIAGKSEVEVLGTHFNINAYSDEATINTTLLEGKVKVKVSTTDSRLPTPDSRLLSPGQQAQLTSSGQILVNKSPDLDEVMAWKNGKFEFGEAMDINAVMRQLMRWYDMDVEYKGKVTGHIGGSIGRDVNVSQVLKMLEMTGAVKFKIEGKKVVVMPR